MSENEFAKQLDDINKVYKERAPQHTSSEKENDDPNIFEILGIENKEVLICRILGDLLNPDGKMNVKSSEPLKAFFKYVLKTESCEMWGQATVKLEEVIDGNRRVDIVIRVGGNVYPIEVKIDAEDQKYQLFDYYHHYFKGEYKNQEKKTIYYLTPTGREPSLDSIKRGSKSINKPDYQTISFREDILKWLENIGGFASNETAAYIIRQFKEVVQKMAYEQESRNALYEALGYKKESGFENKEYEKLLLTIADNHEHIKKTIIQSYIRNHHDLHADTTPYTLSGDITKEDEKKDKHCVLKVINEAGKTVAWICVFDNLYIVTETLKKNAQTEKGGKGGWDIEGQGNKYCWRYLYYSNSEKILGLRNIKEYLGNTKKIAIKEVLEDCE